MTLVTEPQLWVSGVVPIFAMFKLGTPVEVDLTAIWVNHQVTVATLVLNRFFKVKYEEEKRC